MEDIDIENLNFDVYNREVYQEQNSKPVQINPQSIDIQMDDNLIQINCINNEKAYNLLSTVIYKRQLNKIKTLQERLGNYENQKREVSPKLA